MEDRVVVQNENLMSRLARPRMSNTIEKMEIVQNRLFSLNTLAVRSSEGCCPQIFVREKQIMPMLIELSTYGVVDDIFVASLMLVDRITLENRFYLNRRNYYNLMMIAILIQIKFWEDQSPLLRMFPIIFETSRGEINLMERKFLKLVDYKLHIQSSDFNRYKERLLRIKN